MDVSQDVIIREEDCNTERGISMVIGVPTANGVLRRADDVESSVYSRNLAEDVVVEGKTLVQAGADLGDVAIGELIKFGVSEVKVRSVLTCESKVGTCAMCYGRSLATGKLVDVGEAVGIIAAQSIGEPGTQLTMRTFHTGGAVGGDDITQGLPRVIELFEARTPRGVVPIAEAAGVIKIEDTDRTRKIVIVPSDGSEETPTRSPSGCGCWCPRVRSSRWARSSRRARRTRTTCCACSASGRSRCTWSRRSRASTGRRVCGSTTSTS